jgi:hypothetical protein
MSINLKKASLQRIFEYGLKHGRQQGERSMREGNCAMRGEDGLMCVVGAMIDDELANTCDEWVLGDSSYKAYVPSAPTISNSRWALLLGKNERKADLLCEMQRAHDLADRDFPVEFENNMRGVAARFGLRYAEPGITLRS